MGNDDVLDDDTARGQSVFTIIIITHYDGNSFWSAFNYYTGQRNDGPSNLGDVDVDGVNGIN